jgi:hypothetical protein
MQILSITDHAFARYGKVLDGLALEPLLEMLGGAPCPAEGTVYLPSDAKLEGLPVAESLRDRVYGGMPIQIGYCNGVNYLLNCLEYHRGSEVNIAADDIVLLLAPLQAVQSGTLSTDAVEAFLVPAGTAVLLYETTLHYAPCCAPGKDSFRVAVVLPAGTNTEKPDFLPQSAEDQLLWARNKWLLAHPDTSEAEQGAHIGLVGKNLDILSNDD